MAYNDDIKRGRYSYDCLVEYGSYKWSFNGVATDNGYYESVITSIGEVRRVADPASLRFDISSIPMQIKNILDKAIDDEGIFKDALLDGDFNEADVTVKTFVRTDGGTEYTTTIYSGIGNVKQWDRETITLEIRPKIFSKLGPLQRMISLERFSDPADKYVGTGIPLSFAGNYNNRDAAEWVELPQVDTTNRYLAVSQIQPTSDTFDVYYVEEAGGGDPVSVASGVSGTDATDSLGDYYLRYQVAAPDWNTTRRYLCPDLPVRVDTDKPQYPVEDIENMIPDQAFDLTSADVDGDTFDAAISILNSVMGSDASPEVGFSIPASGAPQIEAQSEPTKGWGLLQDMARTLSLSLYITSEGKIGITTLWPWPLQTHDGTSITAPDPVVDYRRDEGDIKDIKITPSPWGVVTDLRTSQDNISAVVAWGKRSERVQNATAAAKYGTWIEELQVKGINLFGRYTTQDNELTAGRMFNEWYCYLRSGAYHSFEITLPHLWGTIPDIGDRITISDNRTVGEQYEILIYGVAIHPSPNDLKVVLYGINTGQWYGSLSIT